MLLLLRPPEPTAAPFPTVSELLRFLVMCKMCYSFVCETLFLRFNRKETRMYRCRRRRRRRYLHRLRQPPAKLSTPGYVAIILSSLT